VDTLVLLAPVALTTMGAYLLGRRRGQRRTALRDVLARLCECVGLTVLFVLLNTAVGAALTLAARAMLHRFVSLYLVTDSVLLSLSAMQAVAFRWWWGAANGNGNGATEAPRHRGTKP
jgi:hypothetical protein